jgi:hypothetical protein
MTVAKLLQNFDEVTGQQLRATDDFDKYLQELVQLAEEKSGEIKPTTGCKDFSTCVTVHNNKLMLWYNDKTNGTRTVELRAY